MAAPPPKSKFDDVAEAKAAMLDIIIALEEKEDELLEASKAAGDDQQKKIAALMPKVQMIAAPVMTKYKFPPPPMGMMIGMMAFTAASNPVDGTPPGLGCTEIKEAMDVMKSAMMSGVAPEKGVLGGLKEKLK